MSLPCDVSYTHTALGRLRRIRNVSNHVSRSYGCGHEIIIILSSAFRVMRMAVQTLSNMVTANESLMTRLWDTYMNLPEEQAIFM